MSYYSLVMASNPNAYYRLGETSGTTANDSTVNGYNGTLSGTVTLNQAGAIKGDTNGSMLGNGTNGAITCAAGLNPSGWTSITAECWFWLSNIAYVNFPRLISCGDPSSSNNGFEISLSASGAGGSFQVGNGTTHASSATATTLVASTWNHWVGVWDGANVMLYVNGVVQTSNALTGSIGNPALTVRLMRYSVSSADFLPGRMDEVAIYKNVALTATQVLAHYNAGIYGSFNSAQGNHRSIGRTQ